MAYCIGRISGPLSSSVECVETFMTQRDVAARNAFEQIPGQDARGTPLPSTRRWFGPSRDTVAVGERRAARAGQAR